jgi:hypothetical protein
VCNGPAMWTSPSSIRTTSTSLPERRASTTRRPARTAATSESELVFVFVGVVWSEKGGYVAQRGHDATRFMAQVQGPVSEASGDRRRASSISASVVAYLNVHWPSSSCPVSFASTGGTLGVT